MLTGVRGLHVAGVVLSLLGWLLAPGPADAGELSGHALRLGGEVSATLGPHDRGAFNRTDYNRDLLRLFRVRLNAELLVSTHVALLGEVRSDDLDTPRVYALYVRARPWRERDLDLQIGRIPPVFGAYPRRRYASNDPLPGVPLVFQYLTSLRADVVPRGAGELVDRRDAYVPTAYGSGTYDAPTGLPFVDSERWDTGAQLRLGTQPLSLAVALTQGSLSRPLVRDDNDGKQLAGRVAWLPVPAWNLGLSAAVGDYLERRALAEAGVSGPVHQSAVGADVQFAYGHWILRAEGVWSRWDQPGFVSPSPRAVSGAGGFVEARCKLVAGVSAAVRAGHLSFGRVTTEQDGAVPWDAPVSRAEAGVAWEVRRHVTLKAAYQGNWRDGGRTRQHNAAVGQIVMWF